MSRAFEARYPGRCTDCGGAIERGQMIRYSAGDSNTIAVGGFVHDGCEDADPEQPPVICTTCWLTKPCDCEAGA
ncbi:hypothetical protein [Xylanimonas protaetiae]|uniref:Uncharacterized protein n=1 Tax=Xylanimonas protaetiae TaxID=2509457 RepID=A0A4P6F5J8_9MICO|nr:hypothetical protein [Xylanimonas protaetiae]QAY70043.1 hypothetical protein ET471_08340 [Xylanimonas protaetiae]